MSSKKSLEHLTEFCRSLKKLAKLAMCIFPNDAIMARANKRIIFAVNEFPIWVIDEVGLHLMKYSEQIDNGDEKFFLKNEYDEEIQENIRNNPETAELTIYIIPKVKDAWRKSDKEARDMYMSAIQSMLDNYVDYKLLTAE